MSRQRPVGSRPSSFVWTVVTVAGLALGAAACGDDKPNTVTGTGGLDGGAGCEHPAPSVAHVATSTLPTVST